MDERVETNATAGGRFGALRRLSSSSYSARLREKAAAVKVIEPHAADATSDERIVAAIAEGKSDWWQLVGLVRNSEERLCAVMTRLVLEQRRVGCVWLEGELDKHGCTRRRYFLTKGEKHEHGTTDTAR